MFDAPWLLLVALVLPLIVWRLRVLRTKQRRERLGRYAESSALSRLVDLDDSERRGRTWRLVTVAVLASLALSGPRWGLARGPVSSLARLR